MAISRAKTKTRVSKRSGRKGKNYSFYYGLLVGTLGTLSIWFGADLISWDKALTIVPKSSEASVNRTYEFFETLPESKVTANPGQYGEGVANIEGAPESKRFNNVEYLVQVASFQNQVEANTLRAELLLDGLQAETSEVILAGQNRWYRVVIGPFQTRQTTQTAINRLNDRPISPLILERPIPELQDPLD